MHDELFIFILIYCINKQKGEVSVHANSPKLVSLHAASIISRNNNNNNLINIKSMYDMLEISSVAKEQISLHHWQVY